MGLGSLVTDTLWKIPVVAIYSARLRAHPAAGAGALGGRSC